MAPALSAWRRPSPARGRRGVRFFPRVQGVIGTARAEELEAPYLAAKRSWLGQ